MKYWLFILIVAAVVFGPSIARAQGYLVEIPYTPFLDKSKFSGWTIFEPLDHSPEEIFSILEKKIREGIISNQDRILILIRGRGDLSNNQYFIKWYGEDLYTSLLKELSDVASEKHIPLGFIVSARYSGRILEFASRSTCVVSLNSDKPTESDSLPNQFFNPKNSIQDSNLEDLYLAARKDLDYHSARWMISSEEGRRVHHFLDGLLKDAYSDSTAIATENKPLAYLPIYEKLPDLETLGIFNSSTTDGDLGLDFSNLETAVNQYRDHRKEFEESLNQSPPVCLPDWNNSKEDFCFHFTDELYNHLSDTSRKASVSDREEISNYYRRAIETPAYKSLMNKKDSSIPLINFIKDVVAEEVKVYHPLYRLLRKHLNQPNACRDFKI